MEEFLVPIHRIIDYHKRNLPKHVLRKAITDKLTAETRRLEGGGEAEEKDVDSRSQSMTQGSSSERSSRRPSTARRSSSSTRPPTAPAGSRSLSPRPPKPTLLSPERKGYPTTDEGTSGQNPSAAQERRRSSVGALSTMDGADSVRGEKRRQSERVFALGGLGKLIALLASRFLDCFKNLELT